MPPPSVPAIFVGNPVSPMESPEKRVSIGSDEHSDAREACDDPSFAAARLPEANDPELVRSQRGGIDFVRALTDPSAQLQ